MELNLASDLKDLLNVLECAKQKWFRIGLQLGISFDKLNGIRGEDDPLLLMIMEWFNCDSPPTKAALVKALRSQSVGENRLAGEIERSTLGQHTTPTTGEDITSMVDLHAAETPTITRESPTESSSSISSSPVEAIDPPSSILSDESSISLDTQYSFPSIIEVHAAGSIQPCSKVTFPHLKTDMNEHERIALDSIH